MAPAKPPRQRVLRIIFAAIALFFVVGNVRSLSNQAFLSARVPAPLQGGWGPGSKGGAVDRGAQRAWARRSPAGPLAKARGLWAVAQRSFLDAQAPPEAVSPAFDEDSDEGHPGGAGADGVAAGAWVPAGRGGDVLPRAVELVAWGRVEAPGAPLEPFCPPIQRPPIG